MRYMKIHFHHVPGHEHAHPHTHEFEDAAGRTPEQMMQLLEYLHHHNEEHAQELEGYRSGVENPTASSLLAESVALLTSSNEKLGEAIAALKEAD